MYMLSCQGSGCRHKVIPSVAPNASQASVCDEHERLVGIGGEIALSGNSSGSGRNEIKSHSLSNRLTSKRWKDRDFSLKLQRMNLIVRR